MWVYLATNHLKMQIVKCLGHLKSFFSFSYGSYGLVYSGNINSLNIVFFFLFVMRQLSKLREPTSKTLNVFK